MQLFISELEYINIYDKLEQAIAHQYIIIVLLSFSMTQKASIYKRKGCDLTQKI